MVLSLIFYRDVRRFLNAQSFRAAAREEDPRARAVGFLNEIHYFTF
jgi:hypothetical protein